MENPIKLDDLGVPLFLETSIFPLYFLGISFCFFWRLVLLCILGAVHFLVAFLPEICDFLTRAACPNN